ncbi:MAG TPA: hydrolase [Armatimonadetes bacterium]|nr:hydrolase [Armatimonadota bacterium]
MPSGRVHEAVNMICLPATFLVPAPIQVLPFVGGYLFGTFFLSPDLDLATSRASTRWGLLRWLWMPYARLAAHRRISHYPIIGLVIRLLYLCILVALGCLIAFMLGWRMTPLAWDRVTIPLMSFVGGLLVADVLHIALDLLVTGVRKLW